MAEEAEAVVVPWSIVWVTLIVSAVVGSLFYVFFVWTRRKHASRKDYHVYETRQNKYADRSPPPFGTASGSSWAMEAYRVDNETLLQDLGLDSYMFIRFLRLGFCISLMGLAFAIILIPVYATGEATGADTEQFTSITLAHVKQGSSRLWAAALSFAVFSLFALYSVYKEWTLYAPLRYSFMARGNVDTDRDYRYAVMVQSLPCRLRSNYALRIYLEQIFPQKVRQVNVLVHDSKLQKLVAERQTNIEALEKATAVTHAKPDKPPPTIKIHAKFKCCGGETVPAIPYYQDEIARLNKEVDTERAVLHAFADQAHQQDANRGPSLFASLLSSFSRKPKHDGPLATSNNNDDEDDSENEKNAGNAAASSSSTTDRDGEMSSTAFVTFTSLRAKQAAIQCEISGKVDNFDVEPAPIPAGIIWQNVCTPKTQQRYASMLAAIFWTVGILFWAFPVAFVTGLANLNSLLQSFGLAPLDSNSFYYGLISGLLPVIFLQILMVVLYISIGLSATHWIRSPSMPAVDGYTFFWHQLYQFANLWLILIGGSLFNQLDALLNNPGQIAQLLASALPGASFFFVNMIIMGSFLALGLELSMIPTCAVNMIMGMLQPEAMRTQRMLDDMKKPPVVIWGQILPPMVFVFLVTLAYMPIVPLMEVFAVVYFGGWYIVWKHQCLHVYHQEFEGGGILWETLSSFLMACLYTAEVIVVAYLGIKVR